MMTCSSRRIRSAWPVAAAFVLGLASAPPALAQETATGNATAQVIAPIAIVAVADLDFGQFSLQSGTGTVVMGTDGTRSTTGDILLVGGTGGAGTFDVTGEAAATYDITLPASATLTGADASAPTMTADTFTSNPSATGTLDGSGAQTISVGATLNVAADQLADTYTGTFDVTVAYN